MHADLASQVIDPPRLGHRQDPIRFLLCVLCILLLKQVQPKDC